jgi:hypothetical protein
MRRDMIMTDATRSRKHTEAGGIIDSALFSKVFLEETRRSSKEACFFLKCTLRAGIKFDCFHGLQKSELLSPHGDKSGLVCPASWVLKQAGP